MYLDRQADRRTQIYARMGAERPVCACRETCACRQKYKQTHEDRQAGQVLQTDRQTDRQTGACRQTYTCRQTEMQTHADRQTYPKKNLLSVGDHSARSIREATDSTHVLCAYPLFHTRVLIQGPSWFVYTINCIKSKCQYLVASLMKNYS